MRAYNPGESLFNPYQLRSTRVNTGRHEFELIEWIRQQTRAHDRIPLGIGDDTAALAFPHPTNCLVTVDMLMEGVHFHDAPGDAPANRS